MDVKVLIELQCFCTISIKYALVITRFQVQYGQHFPSFSYLAELFHEP